MSRGAEGLVMVVAVFILGTLWQSVVNRSSDYACPSCGARFSPSSLGAMLSPHMMGRRLLRCPQCGASGWASRVPKGP